MGEGAAQPVHPVQPVTEEDLKEFLLLVRRALLMIVRWIEKKYRLDPQGD